LLNFFRSKTPPDARPDPVSVAMDTSGTGIASEESLAQAIQEVFHFQPAAIVRQLRLMRPICSKTTHGGHGGRTHDLDRLTWEKADEVAALKKALRHEA
jgi:S-adenosylmethionine synthetase